MSHVCETVKVKADNEQGFVVYSKGEEPEGFELDVEGEEGPKEGTVDWIKAQLDGKEVDYDGVTLKADLQELLDMANETE